MHEPVGGHRWDAAERAERIDSLESLRLTYDLLERGVPPTYVAKIMPFQVASDAGMAHGALLRGTCALDEWHLDQLKNVRQQPSPPYVRF